MNYGFVKCGVFTPNIKVADVCYNEKSIIDGIDKANEKGVEILVLPKLCLTGYTSGDLFYLDTLLSGALLSLNNIKEYTKGKDIVVFISLPIKKDGKLYLGNVCLFNGNILGIEVKSPSGNYERRYFNDYIGIDKINLFNEEVPFGKGIVFFNKEKNYKIAISQNRLLSNLSADIIVDLSADEEIALKKEKRINNAKSLSDILNCAYIYANAGEGESTTDCVYSGHSFIAEKGEILAESELFTNGLIYADIDYEYLQYVNSKNVEDKKENANLNIEFSLDKNSSLERCLDKYPFIQKGIDYKDIILMQAEGLKKRMVHTYSKKLVLGLSGGLDSTLAILVAVKVVDLLGKSRKDVIALTMPCFGTTSRTFENSVSLAKSLGVTLKKIDIGKSVKRHLKDISHPDGVFDSAYENAQARERTQILMDVANMENGMVVGTGDLSELALGFATYNGDHMSMYGVNADIPKTLIRYIVKNYALDFKGKVKAVLLDILDTPISPELLPTSEKETKQKTEDIVGPYILHDYFLYNFLVRGYSPKKILALGEITFKGEFDKNIILKWLKIFFRRFFNQQFKRSCLPDGVKVGEISLSPRGAFTMPSDAVYSLWETELNSL